MSDGYTCLPLHSCNASHTVYGICVAPAVINIFGDAFMDALYLFVPLFDKDFISRFSLSYENLKISSDDDLE